MISTDGRTEAMSFIPVLSRIGFPNDVANVNQLVPNGYKNKDTKQFDMKIYERTIKQLARRPHKGLTGEVFLVAGLFGDQHDPGLLRAFAEHGLGGVFPERAGAATGGVLAQGFEAGHGVFRFR